MERPESHEIETMAQSIFEGLLPAWAVSRLDPDYAKDYLVEVFDENRKATGVHCLVQLKGTKNPHFKNRPPQLTFGLEKKYADHYHDNATTLPVFLVVVDVVQKRAWWIFVQPFLRNNPSWEKLKPTSKVNIPIPLGNQLIGCAQFKQEVDNALRYMRGTHPTAIRDITETQRELVRQLDSRFDASISIENGSLAIGLQPKETVPVTFKFKTKEVREKMDALFGKGALVAFQPGEITVSGTRLFERLEREGGSLQISSDIEATLEILVLNSDGAVIGRLDNIPGKISGGHKEFSFSGGHSGSPLSCVIAPMGENLRAKMHLDLNLSKWDGHPILNLPWFEPLRKWTLNLPGSHKLEANLQVQGELILSAACRLENESATDYSNTLHKAREISRCFEKDPIWRKPDFEDSAESICELYSLLFEDGYTVFVPDCEISFLLAGDRDLEALKRFNTYEESTAQIYRFLGEEFPLQIARRFSPLKLVKVKILTSEPLTRELIFRAARPDTMMIIKRISEIPGLPKTQKGQIL